MLDELKLKVTKMQYISFAGYKYVKITRIWNSKFGKNIKALQNMEVQVREKLRWVCLRKWKLEKLRLRLVLGHVRVRSSSPIDGGLSRGKSSIYTINIYKWLIFHSKTHLVPVTELPFMASKKRAVCATWRTQYSASVRASVSWRFRARDQSIWWEKTMAFWRGKTREALTGNNWWFS